MNQVCISITNYQGELLLGVSEDVILPIIDSEFQITIGGGYFVKEESSIIPFNNIQLISFFPGKIYYTFFLNNPIQRTCLSFSNIKDYEGYLRTCKCNSSFILKSELNLQIFDVVQIAPENRYCDKFSIQFWIKFNEIYQIKNEFHYQVFKINPNTKDERLLNENLSPFQLFYKLSKQNENKIIFTTYSYDLPTVNIDFKQNQFLITKQFEFAQDLLYLWQSISVVLDKKLDVQIKIYKGEQVVLYSNQLDVNHFHQMKLFMELGNINKDIYNYINLFLFSFMFDNCEIHSVEKVCHPSCLECDGPTKNDCLSCDLLSNRIYLPQYKVCICPYNMVDNEVVCLNYENLQLSLINSGNVINYKSKSCEYGFYMEDYETCARCPSIIKDNKVTCLECILNPLTWKQKPVCTLTQIWQENQERTFLHIVNQDTLKNIYQFDGDIITMCDGCDNDQQDIYGDFQEANIYFKQFCQISWVRGSILRSPSLNPNNCYNYKGLILDCDYLILQQTEFTCKICSEPRVFINNQCFLRIGNQQSHKTCITPNFLNSQRECVKCNIINCIYCFEYSEDLNYSTLYRDFEFNKDTQYFLGCALCEEGYQFNFITGNCEIQYIQIEHCLRSFINIKGEEMCTLSDVQDFSVSSEIINCSELIPNCLQCVKTPYNFLQCVVCKKEYCQSLSTNCQLTWRENADICLEGDDIVYNDSRISLIQSFLMVFLPNNYYYPMKNIPQFLRYQVSYKCKKNFALNSKSECVPLCDSNCLQCEENLTTFLFECKICSLNYYKKNAVSQYFGKCIECPQLCLFCQPRVDNQIKIINPYFIVNQKNEKYTYQCTKPLKNSRVNIDERFIASYNFQQNAHFQYKVLVDDYYINKTLGKLFPKNQTYIDFANQMGIKEIQLVFLLQGEYWNYEINNDLKTQIFSLKKSSLILKAVIQHFECKNLEINQFDEVIIEQVQFYVIYGFNANLKNDFPLTLTFVDILLISKNLIVIQFNLKAQKLKKFNANNVTFQNTSIFNSTIFLLEFDSTQNEEAFIININILNSNFSNLIFFNLIDLKYKSNFINISIENCQFSNSTLFSLESINFESTILFFNINIKKSIFVNSFVINSRANSLQISDFILQQNEFFNSKIIYSSQNLQLFEIQIISNHFQNSYLISIVRNNKSETKVPTTLKKILFLQNKVLNFYFFQSDKNLIEDLWTMEIIFDTFLLQGNEKIMGQEFEYSMFQIQKANFQAKHIQIINSAELLYFNLTQVEVVFFFNITMKNDLLHSTIPSSINCQSFQKGVIQLLNLEGFANLQLNKITIKNQLSTDSSFIKISSSLLYEFVSTEKIQMKNFYFQNNILLKTQSNIILSSFIINSVRQQSIKVENITFLENAFHQTVDDTSKFTASLIYIDSALSQIQLQDINFLFNYLTNSSSSFVVISAQDIFFGRVIANNLNFITQQKLNMLYNIEIANNISNNHLNKIFKEIFSIKNIGGLCQLAAENITITNGSFQNIRALQTSICQLTTKGEGIVKILHSQVEQAMSDIMLSISLFGGFNINSFDSFLNLRIKNVTFFKVFNKFGSSILTVVPSQKQNKIYIKDVVVNNCLSLINQVFNFEFSGQQTLISSIKISNFTFQLDEQNWIEYFNIIQDINEFDVETILSSSSIISISSSEIELFNLYFSGVILGQLLKIINSQKIKVSYLKAYDIHQIYPDDLIFFGQNDQNKQQILILSSEIQRYSKYSPQKLILSQQNLIFHIDNDQCSQLNYQIVQGNKDYLNYIDLFLKYSTRLGSIIYFSSTSNQTTIEITKLNIEENNCPQFSSALSLILKTFKKIIVSEIICIRNKFTKQGCLYLYSASQYDSPIKIKNSFFLLNEGINGSAIFAQNINLQIKYCYFMNNSAEEQGGAVIYFGKNLVFKNSFILFNKASIGGGIATSMNSFPNQDKPISLFLQFNKALFASSNILSLPTHLALIINNQQMKTEIINISNQLIFQLQIKPYITIEQEIKIMTKYLMLPANQIIGNYYILNPKNFEYYQQIKSLKFTLRNAYDEILPNQQDFVCSVNQVIQQKPGLTSEPELIVNQLVFNQTTNYFIFDQFKIIYDPYILNQSLAILDIQCQCSSSDKILTYKIQSKIYICQLGEYYIENVGCQICDPVQGYYSVAYNATKCSLMDKTKYKNITSNQIELLPGFWRSNKYSDITEFCFKKQKACQGGWNTGNQLCADGNIGGLCEECDIQNLEGYGHYFKDSQNQECWNCEKSTRGLIGFFLILLWSILSTLLTLSSVKMSNKLFSRLMSMQKYGKIIFKLNQDHKSFLIKMLINYLWIFSAIFTFNITFSFQANIVEQVSNPSVFMANSLDCYLQGITRIELLYFRVVVAFLLIFTQFLVIATISSFFYQLQKKNIDNSLYSNILIYLYLQNNGAIMKQLSSLLAQRSISGVFYISGDVSRLYFTENHLNWLKFFIIPSLITVSFLIPIMLITLLLLNKKKLNIIRVRKHLGYLFNEYKEEKFYWELVKISKQSMLILILIVFETQVLIKAIIIGSALILYQILATQLEPFNIKHFNKLDLQSGQLCLSGIFLGAIKFQTEQVKNLLLAQLLQVVILILLLRICYPFVSKLLTIYFKKDKVEILKQILRVFACFLKKSKITLYLSNYIKKLEADKKNLNLNIEKIRQLILNKQTIIQNFEQRIQSFNQIKHSQFLAMNTKLLTQKNIHQKLESEISLQNKEN